MEPPLPSALPMIVSHREGGERLRLRSDGPRRLLKHILQDAGVPPWQRARWPVIRLDDDVAAFADLIVADTMQARLATLGVSVRFDPH